jgi:uncharacterized protein YbaP (TraB family)
MRVFAGFGFVVACSLVCGAAWGASADANAPLGQGWQRLASQPAVVHAPTRGAASPSQATALVGPQPRIVPHAPLPHVGGPPDTAAANARPAYMPFYVATRGTTTLYLLGTLHVGSAADYPPNQPFRQRILDALDGSAIIALELSPEDLVVSQDDVTKYGVCARACLPRMVPASMWAKIVRRMRGHPAALAQIKRSRPWLAAMLVETYDSLAAGLQAEYGSEPQIENLYTGRARIVGLETLEEQMLAFTNLTLPEQQEMLAQDLAQTPAQNAADVRVLHQLWRAGDADAMAGWEARKSEMVARSQALSDRIDEQIVFARNRRFVDRMLLRVGPDRPVFVAIGALHLGGPKGVLALLRERGFDVRAQ